MDVSSLVRETYVYKDDGEEIDAFEFICTVHQILDFYYDEYHMLLSKEQLIEELREQYGIIRK